MKFIHLADLHIGKRVNEFSMIEDQRYILKKILQIIRDEQPECVLISGDIYDKSIPSSESVTIFDEFLVELTNCNTKIMAISGNHDSAERIAFASEIMAKSDVYMSRVYNGNIEKIELNDQYGNINFYLLPFIKPTYVRAFFPDAEIHNYNEAIKTALSVVDLDKADRNILLAHQFFTGAITCESEEISVGGSDNVSTETVEDFDYVALGHIHRPQSVSKDTIRYCGTPLKYSFSEANDIKSVTVVEIAKKGDLQLRTIPLTPLHDMVKIRGSYEEIIDKTFYQNLNTNDYFHITLTDEEDVFDALDKLRIIYKNIMKLDYDNKRTRHTEHIDASSNIKQKPPIEIVSEFYNSQNNQELSSEQTEFMKKLIEDIWSEC